MGSRRVDPPSDDPTPEHDFEAALAGTLEEGERVESLWPVSPGRYLLGLLQLARFLKLRAIVLPVLLVGALYPMVQLSRRFWQGALTLPSTPREWILLAFVPVALFAFYMAISETLQVMTARCVLTQRRWLSFKRSRAHGWRAEAIRLDRCAWRLERDLLMVYELSPRKTITEALPALGLANTDGLREQLRTHVGPELTPEAARSLERQHEEADEPAGALTPVFRRLVEPVWTERVALGGQPAASPWFCTGCTFVWAGILFLLLRWPTTTREWAAWAAAALAATIVYRWWAGFHHRRETAPVLAIAESHWWRLEREAGPERRYVPVAVLPLSGREYVVHEATVYVPHGPIPVEGDWIEGETDAVAKIASALQALPASPGFTPADWHPLHPATPALLAQLDAAGAVRGDSGSDSPTDNEGDSVG